MGLKRLVLRNNAFVPDIACNIPTWTGFVH